MKSEITYCCIQCGNQIKWWSALYGTGLCKSCAFTGKNSGMWKGGKPKCKNCGKELSAYHCEYCVKCSHKKELNANWKGGNPHCIDCGAIVSSRDALRCKKCLLLFQVGTNHPMYNKKHSIETIKKISINTKGKNLGETSPHWNPNISNEERRNRRHIQENYNWRDEVYKRDNFTCQCCGDNKGRNLNAHHLEGYHWCKELRYEVNNGITICKKCHNKFHKQFGYLWNTTEQFYIFTRS